MTVEKAPKAALLVLLLVFAWSTPGWAGEKQVLIESRIVVVSQDRLEELGIQSAADLLEAAPTAILDARQMHLRLAEEALLSGSEFRGNLDAIPTRDIQRIEILKGPAAATLYGRQASTDVINFTPRPDYSGIRLNGSWTLSKFLPPLSRLWVSTEHSGECDATNGVIRPLWSLFSDHDWAGPTIVDDGDTWLYGSQSKGFTLGGYKYPKFGRFGPPEPDFTDPKSMRAAGFTVLADLVERVENDPSMSEEARSAFMGGLGFILAFGGPSSVSDLAAAFGDFDPDEIYNTLKEVSADADTGAVPAPTPRTQTGDRPAGTTEVAGDEQPLPEPFAGYPYPPEYLLDDPNDCPEEVKKKVRELIRERDQARADISYYMDYLRREGQSAEDTAEDMREADEARKLRDQKNDEIKELLRKCVPQTATTEGSGTSPSAPEATSGDEAQSSSGARRDDNWRLELRVSYNALGDDGSVHKEPAQGVFLGLHEYKYGTRFRLPGAGAFKDTEMGASDSGRRKITGADGGATFDLGGFKPRLRWSMPSKGFSSPGRADIRWGLKLGIEPDFQLGLGWKDRTIRVNTHLEKTDSVIQQFPGQGGRDSASIRHVPTGLFTNYVNDEFSVGRNFYREYAFPEFLNLDLGELDSIPGQAGFENNTCGDSALPPNGLGYLSQATSSVQSVEDQWALEHVGLTDDVAVAEATSSNAAPIVVGVIDTGLDWNHLDLAWENIWRNEDEIPDNGIDDDGNGFVDDIIGWDFMNKDNKPWDNDGHGTFVAGIIAATHNNGTGIDGVNPNARVMVLKALNNFGRTRASYVAQAIVYGADNGARILNLSVSGGDVPQVLIDALGYARGKGVLVITAAGNRGENIDRGPPGGVPALMSVAATGPDDKRAVFSNVGSSINIAAPGVDIVSLRARRTDFMLNSATTTYQAGDSYLGKDSRYYRSTGTSFATPIVSGIASLVWSNRPELTATQVQRILEQSARDVELPGRDRFTGYGVVDVRAALEADPEFFVDAAILLVQRMEEDEQVFVQVFGSADANQFGRAWLEIGEGEDPSHWITIGDALPDAVRLGVLGGIPADRLAGAKVWTVRVIVEHQNGRQREARYVIELG